MEIRTDVKLRQYTLQNARGRRLSRQSYPFLRRYAFDDRCSQDKLEDAIKTKTNANTSSTRFGAVIIGRYFNSFFWEELLDVLKREDPLKYIDRK